MAHLRTEPGHNTVARVVAVYQDGLGPGPTPEVR